MELREKSMEWRRDLRVISEGGVDRSDPDVVCLSSSKRPPDE